MKSVGKKIGYIFQKWTGIHWLGRLDHIERFTLALTILAGMQFYAFVKSERAFVFPSEVKFVNWGDLDAVNVPLRLEIEIANSGKETAVIEKLSAAVTHGPLEKKPRYGPGLVEVVYPPVVREGKSTQLLSFDKWPKETRDKVLNGTMNFYIFGFITYGDGWGLTYRHSRFCFRYDVDLSAPNRGVFRACYEPGYTSTD